MDEIKGVSDFYDDFSESQMRMGINHRHLRIRKWLEKLGLRRDSRVLEIGCGIGTLSELVLRFLNTESEFLGLDISPKSIEIANRRLGKYPNAKFLVYDITETALQQKYDVIILPDVIEHIPIDLHRGLFININAMLNDHGIVVVNIPHPYYLQHCIDQKMPGLQIIDQPIHISVFEKNLAEAGLYIDFLAAYSVFTKPCDYQISRLRRIPKSNHFQPISPISESFWRRIKNKLRFIARGGM